MRLLARVSGPQSLREAGCSLLRPQVETNQTPKRRPSLRSRAHHPDPVAAQFPPPPLTAPGGQPDCTPLPPPLPTWQPSLTWPGKSSGGRRLGFPSPPPDTASWGRAARAFPTLFCRRTGVWGTGSSPARWAPPRGQPCPKAFRKGNVDSGTTVAGLRDDCPTFPLRPGHRRARRRAPRPRRRRRAGEAGRRAAGGCDSTLPALPSRLFFFFLPACLPAPRPGFWTPQTGSGLDNWFPPPPAPAPTLGLKSRAAQLNPAEND